MQTATRGATRHRFGLLLVVIGMALLIGACASSAGAPVGPGQGGAVNGQQPDNAGAPAASAAPFAPGGDPGGETGQGENAAFQDGAKIIRTGSLQMEVEDVPAALTTARTAILGLGGFIGASQQYRDGDDVVATITYRIPADRWEDALDKLRGLGTEVGEQTGSDDVTGQLVDLEARIRNLKASETALVAHLEAATRIDDVLEIESRLSDVRGQIEQLAAQQARLDDQVAYATLTVTYGVEVQAVQAAAAAWDPQGEVERAGASLLGFLQALATAGIWFGIVLLPILAVIGIGVGAVAIVGRRFGWFRRPPAVPPVPPMPPTPGVAEG
jgi:hypothetical protein